MESVIKEATYKQQQLRNQLSFLGSSDSFSNEAKAGDGTIYDKRYKFVLPDACRDENLFERIRKDVTEYFQIQGIQWHPSSAHLLSSQVCCLNVLAPFMHNPGALKTLLEPVLGPIEEMLPIEEGRFIAFEFTGSEDYLHEWRYGTHKRGANCTSADAAVKFRTKTGKELALIEWKYTESYAPHREKESSNKERRRRYENIAFDSHGPVVRPGGRFKLTDLFAEPIYQLFRQQMLAYQMERDKALGLKRVRTVLIVPQGNTAFRKLKIPALAQFGGDNIGAWHALLQKPERFVSCTTEDLLAGVSCVLREAPELKSWSEYIAQRYGFIGDLQNPHQAEAP